MLIFLHEIKGFGSKTAPPQAMHSINRKTSLLLQIEVCKSNCCKTGNGNFKRWNVQSSLAYIEAVITKRRWPRWPRYVNMGGNYDYIYLCVHYLWNNAFFLFKWCQQSFWKHSREPKFIYYFSGFYFKTQMYGR